MEEKNVENKPCPHFKSVDVEGILKIINSKKYKV